MNTTIKGLICIVPIVLIALLISFAVSLAAPSPRAFHAALPCPPTPMTDMEIKI